MMSFGRGFGNNLSLTCKKGGQWTKQKDAQSKKG